MLALPEITLSLFTLCAIVLFSLFTGFVLKNVKLSKLKRVVEKLEKEMLNNHAEILQLQKELSNRQHNQLQAPVFSIRDTPNEVSKETLPDTGHRKKVLSGIGKLKS